MWTGNKICENPTLCLFYNTKSLGACIPFVPVRPIEYEEEDRNVNMCRSYSFMTHLINRVILSKIYPRNSPLIDLHYAPLPYWLLTNGILSSIHLSFLRRDGGGQRTFPSHQNHFWSSLDTQSCFSACPALWINWTPFAPLRGPQLISTHASHP